MELRIVSPCSATQCISLGESDEVRISWRELFPYVVPDFFRLEHTIFQNNFFARDFFSLKHPDYILDYEERSSRSHVF